jgi:uncharacterized protein (DUF952 family)
MSDLIYHITSRVAWEAAQQQGAYAADTLARQGFIHCSKADQILRVANVYYKGLKGLVILAIDPNRLTATLKWEPGTDKVDELFPHIYGPVKLDAVQIVLDFEPNPDDMFGLPKDLR